MEDLREGGASSSAGPAVPEPSPEPPAAAAPSQAQAQPAPWPLPLQRKQPPTVPAGITVGQQPAQPAEIPAKPKPKGPPVALWESSGYMTEADARRAEELNFLTAEALYHAMAAARAQQSAPPNKASFPPARPAPVAKTAAPDSAEMEALQLRIAGEIAAGPRRVLQRRRRCPKVSSAWRSAARPSQSTGPLAKASRRCRGAPQGRRRMQSGAGMTMISGAWLISVSGSAPSSGRPTSGRSTSPAPHLPCRSRRRCSRPSSPRSRPWRRPRRLSCPRRLARPTTSSGRWRPTSSAVASLSAWPAKCGASAGAAGPARASRGPVTAVVAAA